MQEPIQGIRPSKWTSCPVCGSENVTMDQVRPQPAEKILLTLDCEDCGSSSESINIRKSDVGKRLKEKYD